MPLIKTIANSIFCWKNEESPTELLKQLNNQAIHQNKIQTFKSEERIKQYLTNRILVQNIIGDYEIKKGKNNKPYLDLENTEISFSHNKAYTILMVSNTACGVDVQAPTEKVLRVKSKFINANDFCYKSEDIQLLSKVWSCKEAAFKQFGTHEIYLKSHINVIQQTKDDIFEALVTIDNIPYQTFLKQVEIENNYLLYTIN
ncbi:MAG: hypothetical protein N4A35_17140 [Flavobacteriales bacterium]|jgi:phosphopantetheinyl transferase|nr:hypothetical protein [Flavobacteriales bacterium]